MMNGWLSQELSDPVASLEDLDRFSLENMDELRHLSLSVLKQGSFEKEALVWVSFPVEHPLPTGTLLSEAPQW